MTTLEKKPLPDILIILPLLALAVDLCTPFLIWKNVLPAEVRWLSHFTIALMIFLAFTQALSIKHIPGAFWAVLAIAILWSYVALGHRQGIPSTLWGVWLLFQFPLISLFIYLQPNLPKEFPAIVRNVGLIILGIEVIIQLLQYIAGQPPGDNLSGFFGKNGTGNAIVFEILVICLLFGYWITNKHWLGISLGLMLGALSSALGEMKLFLFAVLAISLTAIFLSAIKNHSIGKSMVYSALVIAALNGFVFLYNLIVPVAAEIPLQTYYTNLANTGKYLSQSTTFRTSEGLRTDIGRADAVKIGLNSLNKDPITFLFGYGIGARSESRTFGTAGIALTSGNLGLSVGTSLLIFMQEMGLIGLVVLASFIVWVLSRLLRDIRGNPLSSVTELRYGLMLFTLFLPVWIFYTNVWTMRVPMLIYWLALGYVFAEHPRFSAKIQDGK
jgi:hypothetical protein